MTAPGATRATLIDVVAAALADAQDEELFDS
jgi:hypothetical protein